jgi:hypothetical protein
VSKMGRTEERRPRCDLEEHVTYSLVLGRKLEERRKTGGRGGASGYLCTDGFDVLLLLPKQRVEIFLIHDLHIRLTFALLVFC